KRLYEFLRDTRNLQSTHSKPTDRVAITTHQTLIRMIKYYMNGEFDKLFTNTSVLLDEIHHCSQTQTEDEMTEGVNQLGKVVARLYDSPASHLTLITATMFRTDETPIITGKALAEFGAGQFILPYDEYLAEMIYLKSFGIQIILYDGNNWLKGAEIIAKATQKRNRTSWYVPCTNSNDAIIGSHKNDDAAKLTRIIKKYPAG